jgi:lipoprotein-anchoring transpeptidase ErfK/SrfK
MRHSTRFFAGFISLAIAGAALLTPQAAGAGTQVAFNEGSAGTIVIKTNQRRLYYVLGGGRAIAYPVGVGRAGKQWAGTAFIDGMRLKPAWSPPDDVRRDKPSLPAVIPGGTPGNPMGAAALTLSGGQYAIHGTNAPGSVGGFVSYGCIRMLNFGTPVVVTH